MGVFKQQDATTMKNMGHGIPSQYGRRGCFSDLLNTINIVALIALSAVIVLQAHWVRRELLEIRGEARLLLQDVARDTLADFVNEITMDNERTTYIAHRARDVLEEVIRDSKHDLMVEFFNTLFTDVLPTDIVPVLDVILRYNFTEFTSLTAETTRAVAHQMNKNYPDLYNAADVVNKVSGVFNVVSHIEPLGNLTMLPEGESVLSNFLLGIPEMLYNAVRNEEEWHRLSEDCTTMALRVLKANFQGCYLSRGEQYYANSPAHRECWNFNSEINNIVEYVAEVCDSIRSVGDMARGALKPDAEEERGEWQHDGVAGELLIRKRASLN